MIDIGLGSLVSSDSCSYILLLDSCSLAVFADMYYRRNVPNSRGKEHEMMDLAFPGMAAATVTISAQIVPMNSYATCSLDMLSWVQQSLANISTAMCIFSVHVH